MSSTKGSLARVVRRATTEDRRRLGSPPSPDELADFAAGALSEDEAERIREHLALRKTGRDVVLDLKSFPRLEPSSAAFEVSDEQLEEAWGDLEAELGLGTVYESEPSAALSRPVERGFGFWAWLEVLREKISRVPGLMPTLATACFVGLLGVSYLAVSLNGQVRDLRSPQLNVAVSDLTLVDAVVRSNDPEKVPLASATADSYVWNLNLEDLKPYAAYQLEILDESLQSLWSGRTDRRTEAGNLTLGLRRGFLATGSYRVRLWGIDGGDRNQLAEYIVRIP